MDQGKILVFYTCAAKSNKLIEPRNTGSSLLSQMGPTRNIVLTASAQRYISLGISIATLYHCGWRRKFVYEGGDLPA